MCIRDRNIYNCEQQCSHFSLENIRRSDNQTKPRGAYFANFTPTHPAAQERTCIQAVKTDGSSISAAAGCGVGMDVCLVNSPTGGPMPAVATSAGLSIFGHTQA